MSDAPDDRAPARVRRPAPLTSAQRRRVALVGLAPVVLAAAVLTPVALVTGARAGEVVAAALVYGGLLGLAAGFVAVDRFHARQCPRCRAVNERGATRCGGCGYDLEHRPRYVCDERHAVHLEPGRCDCGRWLRPLPQARGARRELVLGLKVGAWLLAFLVGMALLLQVLERNL